MEDCPHPAGIPLKLWLVHELEERFVQVNLAKQASGARHRQSESVSAPIVSQSARLAKVFLKGFTLAGNGVQPETPAFLHFLCQHSRYDSGMPQLEIAGHHGLELRALRQQNDRVFDTRLVNVIAMLTLVHGGQRGKQIALKDNPFFLKRPFR